MLLVALLSATAKAVAVVFGLCAAVATWRLVQDLRRRDTGAALYHGLVAAVSWAVCLGPVLFRSVEGYFSGPNPYARANLSGTQFVLVLVLVLWAILFLSRVSTQRGVARALAGEPAPGGTGMVRDRMAYLARAATGNVSVYSAQAPAGPFVGAGEPVTAWTMTVPLAPLGSTGPLGDTGPTLDLRDRPELEVGELYDRLRERLELLAVAPVAGRPLAGLTVEERIYLAGRLPARHPLLDGGVPVPQVPAAILRDVAVRGRGTERFYLGARMTGPDAGAALGCFVYLSLVGGMLFVEFVQTSVPAVRADFRATAGVTDQGAAAVLSALAVALVDVVKVAPIAPIETGRRLLGLLRDVLQRPLAERAERLAGQFDYGARTGLRELAADPGHRVVDELDLNEYARVVERCLLDSLAETLTGHGFDPGALRPDPEGPGRRTTLSLRREPVAEQLGPV